MTTARDVIAEVKALWMVGGDIKPLGHDFAQLIEKRLTNAGFAVVPVEQIEGAEQLRAAIDFALEADDGLEWLRAWREGDAEAMQALAAAQEGE